MQLLRENSPPKETSVSREFSFLRTDLEEDRSEERGEREQVPQQGPCCLVSAITMNSPGDQSTLLLAHVPEPDIFLDVGAAQ